MARDRLEQKKTSLVTGTLGALISRPKPEDIQIVLFESRLEAFWLIDVFVRTVYERSHTYAIPVNGPEVQHVAALGQDLPVTVIPKGVPVSHSTVWNIALKNAAIVTPLMERE